MPLLLLQDAAPKFGSIPFPVMLGSVVAAVGYAGMVTSYYLAQQQLKEKLRIVQEQHEKFVDLHTKLGENGTCQGVLDSVMQYAEVESSQDGIPIVSILIMLVGCILLGVFFFQEYNVAMKKKASSRNIAFTFGELVGYRLDYHFSSSKMAKPLLLFAITFVLILSSTIGFALVSGEDIASSMWRSWTYGAPSAAHAVAPCVVHRPCTRVSLALASQRFQPPSLCSVETPRLKTRGGTRGVRG